ncbi:MAG: Dyp-type peroxidase [Burkholderiales bacterium]|nr:Dyp-type peroxidase [Burkholderiales bacterium]
MRPDIKSTQLGGIANLALVAPVKPGFIPGADTVTYARRLEALLKTLMAIRLGSRETSRFGIPFPDAVGRLGILQSFRYAVIPPRVGSRGEDPLPPGVLDAGLYRLYLNVVFDGGWEPYMRAIYRDLGYLLDTIFCNTVGYRLSTQHSYDEYCRWVREHEVPAGILYTESSASVLDLRYAEAVERRQREEADPARARQAVAGFALQPPIDTATSLERLGMASEEARREVVTNSLRALKGLYDLHLLHPKNADRDDVRILAFTQRAMPEFRAFLERKRGEPWLQVHREHVDWILRPRSSEQPPIGTPATFEGADIQSGIHKPYEAVTHGCLLLLRVTNAQKARAWIDALPKATAERQAAIGETLYWNVAFSANGLRALGVPPSRIDRFPQEFVEGMEARAGMLGDVRTNHPEHWRRPRLASSPQIEVDLGSVDVAVQYRLASKSEPERQLHSALAALAAAIDKERDGLLVLAVEPMRSYPSPTDVAGTVTEHFGFADGLSQPAPNFAGAAPPPPPKAYDNSVLPGEIYLGHPSDRDRGRFPDTADALMDNGSFLVVRKLRQHVGRWQAMLARAAERRDPLHAQRSAAEQALAREDVAAKLMGRRYDGTVLADPAQGAGNDFHYDADPTGARCPFSAHIRRTNPRSPAIAAAGQQKLPRILRRGMSYGPRFGGGPLADASAERGLFFMAYCGSLAEQFEIIQRWIAGGNSTGVHSSHSDPMLGVPQKGTPRLVQWLGEDGQAVTVDLGDEPLVQLEWGLYLFTPSLTGLKALTAGLPADAPAPPVASCPLKHEPYAPAGDAFEERKLMLQGRRDDKDELWRAVNACGGTLQTAYGLLEGRKDKVLAALHDAGTRHSVCGYGRRFAASVGPGFLGMDDPDHKRLAVKSGIKQAIAGIDEGRAFEAARAAAAALLDGGLKRLAAAGQAPTIDLVRLSEMVVARLYFAWWGLPDGQFMKEGYSTLTDLDEAPDAYCPRDFVFVARLNFGAHPSPTETRLGTTRGQAIQSAVRRYLQAVLQANAADKLVYLTKFIHDALMKDPARPGAFDETVWTIGGTMLGFGPSTHQHFVQVVRDWIEPSRSGGTTLWDLQALLLAEGATVAPTLAAAQKVLRAPLVAQMRREPVPGVIWREKPGTTKAPEAPEPPKLMLGLHGLMDDADAEALMFGGTLDPSDKKLFGVHACPGHGMAIGVLLGVLSALLTMGTLKRTPSSTIVMIER